MENCICKFLICINNKNYEASLEKWKIYPVVKEKEKIEGYVRIIDESGEDYLYPEDYFFPYRIVFCCIRKIKRRLFRNKKLEIRTM